jgi:hypothetical protein
MHFATMWARFVEVASRNRVRRNVTAFIALIMLVMGSLNAQESRATLSGTVTDPSPAVLNVEEWADYWASLKTDVVMVSVTGILAFYPSKVPFHKQGKFLNGRDFTGELVAAAKKRNIRVIARFSPALTGAMHSKPIPSGSSATKKESL